MLLINDLKYEGEKSLCIVNNLKFAHIFFNLHISCENIKKYSDRIYCFSCIHRICHN